MGSKQSRPEYSANEPDYAYPDYAFPHEQSAPAEVPAPVPVPDPGRKNGRRGLFKRRKKQHHQEEIQEVQEVQMDPYGYPIQPAEIYPPLQDPGQAEAEVPGQKKKSKKRLFGRKREQEVHSDRPPDPNPNPNPEHEAPPPVPPKQAYQTYLSTRPHIQIHRPSSPSHSPLLIPLTSRQPKYTPHRYLHPAPTVRLPKPGTFILRNVRNGGAGLKRGSVERGSLREGLRGLRDGRREARGVERERRRGDAQREYAALKIQTEQDLYRASRRGKNDQAGVGGYPEYGGGEGYGAGDHPDQTVYGNVPAQSVAPVQDPHYQPYQPHAQPQPLPQPQAGPEYDYQPYADQPSGPPVGGPGRGRSIWTRDRWTRTTSTREADPGEETMNVPKSRSKKKVQWGGGGGGGGGGGFRGKHGMRHVAEDEVRDY